MLFKAVTAPRPLAILFLMSSTHSVSSVITASRYVKVLTCSSLTPFSAMLHSLFPSTMTLVLLTFIFYTIFLLSVLVLYSVLTKGQAEPTKSFWRLQWQDIYTGWKPFLKPTQQCQSMKNEITIKHTALIISCIMYNSLMNTKSTGWLTFSDFNSADKNQRCATSFATSSLNAAGVIGKLANTSV